jgi:hypothetical protein
MLFCVKAGARSLGETAVPECFGDGRAEEPTLAEGEGIARSQIHAIQKELLCICCRCTFGSDLKTRCEKNGKACEGLVGCRPRCARGRRCHDAMVGRWEVGANNRGAVLRSRQHDFNTSILHISLITTVPIIRIMYSILP